MYIDIVLDLWYHYPEFTLQSIRDAALPVWL